MYHLRYDSLKSFQNIHREVCLDQMHLYIDYQNSSILCSQQEHTRCLLRVLKHEYTQFYGRCFQNVYYNTSIHLHFEYCFYISNFLDNVCLIFTYTYINSYFEDDFLSKFKICFFYICLYIIPKHNLTCFHDVDYEKKILYQYMSQYLLWHNITTQFPILEYFFCIQLSDYIKSTCMHIQRISVILNKSEHSLI